LNDISQIVDSAKGPRTGEFLARFPAGVRYGTSVRILVAGRRWRAPAESAF
jgi:hypothetical protein